MKNRDRWVQIAGSLIGLLLLAWCVRAALNPDAAEGWQRLREARPVALAGLLLASVASIVINGLMFQVSLRPVRRVRFREMQWLNVTAGLLNYAPVRLGAMARFIYHVRVDGLSIPVVAAWFALLAGVVLTAALPAALLLLLRPVIDLLAVIGIIGGALLGIMIARALLLMMLGIGPVGRIAADAAAIIRSPIALPAATLLRVLDFFAYAARLWIAIHILELSLSGADAMLLAVVALVSGLIPFGRLGFREFCVAIAAAHLSSGAEEIEANMAQLALIDSAAEMLVFLPFGAMGLWWYRGRVLRRADLPQNTG